MSAVGMAALGRSLRVLARVTCLTLGFASALGPARAETIDFGRFHALVVGNNDYEHWTPLTTAVGDAEEVAEILESKYGFRVERLENATRSQIVRALNQLRSELTEGDSLLIYYAGHGQIDGEDGFWIGVDGERNFEDSWVPVSTITRNLKHMSADSCYSGTLTLRRRRCGSSHRAGAKRVAHANDDKRARLALTSGGLEPVSDIGGGEHSVFANEFLDALAGC